MSKLRIRNGPYAGREVTLASEPVTIGRDAEATIQILDRSASRIHSEVFPVGGMYFVRDLDSKNGTLINDERLADEELLRESDVIKIGSTELIFESGIALADSSAGDNLAYDDEARLSNTIEIKINDLSDIEDQEGKTDNGEERYMRILYQLSKTLTDPDSPDPLAAGLDLLIHALPADNANVLMRQGRGNKLIPRCIRTAHQWGKPVIARSIIKRTLTENRAVLTENAADDQRFKRHESVAGGHINSVICVPITVGGAVRGVLYLSRAGAEEPFTHGHLELLSGCAIQIGLNLLIQEQSAAQQRIQWATMLNLVRCMEHGGTMVGRGERTARVVRALCLQLGISDQHNRTLQFAAILHHVPDLCSEGAIEHLDHLHGLDEAVALVRNVRRGMEPEEGDNEVQERLLATAIAYERALAADNDSDALVIIGRLEDSSVHDQTVIRALRSCYLEGKL